MDIISQNKTNYTVGVFLYDGVELLDFSGPAQVFAVAEGFTVRMVSVEKRKIRSQGCVTILPDYSLDDSPQLDLAVLPGGNTDEVKKDDRVIGWVRRCSEKGTILFSVCTGARILARAGLLNEQKAITWHAAVDAFQKQFPAVRVVRDARWVDCGNIITTAGVSAGIDGALHLVARLMGREEAQSTAQYMEYERWRPDDGIVVR